MMKMKLLTTVLIVLAAVGFVTAAEVINVDIQGDINSAPYVGNGAYDVGANAVWTAYYGTFGVPVGSARSEALVLYDVPLLQQYFSSVYAAQVWIGDNGELHDYYGSGTGLMDDGYVADAGQSPKIALFGAGAYQGVYDIYVYGAEAGSFTLTLIRDGNTSNQTLPVDGDANEGMFEPGHNYVLFENVDINDSNSNNTYISYTNVINGLQLVKQKEPFAIEPNSLGLIRIAAGNWDVAGERNTRATESARFGPDTWFDDGNGIGRVVGYLDSGEFMGYDITVDEANEGQYQISLGVMGGTLGYINNGSMYIYLDDRSIGEVNLATAATTGNIGETTKVTANLYKGSHTVRWFFSGYAGTNTGFSLADVNFVRIGPAVISNCADVVNYGFAITEDFNGNCVVALDDLALLVDNWLICNNPDPNGCF
jgi:hypothetical protein